MSPKHPKLSLPTLILMIFTSVYGFANIPRSFYLMGYAAIPWFMLAGLAFFLPFSFIIAEFGAAYKDYSGGIYAWMEESSGKKYAFIVVFIWYASFIIWQVNVASMIWVVLSNAVFGRDTTQTWSLFGLSSVQSIGLLAMLWVLFMTFLSSKGLRNVRKITSIGGAAVVGINLFLWLGGLTIFLLKGGIALEPVTFSAFIQSPHPDFRSLIKTLSFVVYAIFAYGGIEVIGGLVDETENPQVNFPRGVMIASAVITIGYALGIFIFGLISNWQFVFEEYPTTQVTLGNDTYIAMNQMGYQIGLVLGMTEKLAGQLGVWVARYVGLSMFLALTGAFITLVYSPLRQLIGGTPAAFWPPAWTQHKKGVYVRAMWYQAVVVIGLIALVSFGGKTASRFFEIVVNMTNVSIALPYFFIAYSFISFKQKDQIDKPYIRFRSMASVRLVVLIVCLMVGSALLFTVIEPAISQGDYVMSLMSIGGPVFFALVAHGLYHRYEKNNPS